MSEKGKLKKRLAATAAITALCLAVIVTLMATGITGIFENKLYDLRFRWRGVQPIHNDLALAGIDDQTCEVLGQWPWTTREFYAAFLEALSNCPPVAIGFDILFRPKDESARISFDSAFAGVMAYFDNPPCVGYNFYFPGEGKTGIRGIAEADMAILEKFKIGSVKNIPASFPYITDAALPYQSLAQNATLGFLNAPRRDRDGVLREMPLVAGLIDKERERSFYPSLTLSLVLAYHTVSPDDVQVVLGNHIKFTADSGEKITIPIDKNGFFRINFAGNIPDFQNVPFAEIIRLRQQDDLDALEKYGDKILVVGLVATGTSDVGPLPINSSTPLVAAHLNVINSILTGQYVTVASTGVRYALVVIAALLIAAISTLCRPRNAIILTICLMLVFIIVTLGLFFKSTIVLPMLEPVLAMLFTYIGIIGYRYMREEKQKLWIKKVLRQYLADSVMQELLDNPDKLQLGGERKELTVMFSDIVGFTTFCENRPSEEVVQRLNQFMDTMTEAIFNNSGTLDKYVGDEIVAFFGAPGDEHADDHAVMAVKAAMEMLERLEILKEEWRKEGVEELDCGIGINTGEMLVGNMGSSSVFDYTVIGDEVNLGARVEGLTRKYKAPLVITESTKNKIEHIFQTRELGDEAVKGRRQPVKVFTVQ
jgi:adenylate cyclase